MGAAAWPKVMEWVHEFKDEMVVESRAHLFFGSLAIRSQKSEDLPMNHPTLSRLPECLVHVEHHHSTGCGVGARDEACLRLMWCSHPFAIVIIHSLA